MKENENYIGVAASGETNAYDNAFNPASERKRPVAPMARVFETEHVEAFSSNQGASIELTPGIETYLGNDAQEPEYSAVGFGLFGEMSTSVDSQGNGSAQETSSGPEGIEGSESGDGGES